MIQLNFQTMIWNALYSLCNIYWNTHFVGNKAKGRILKRVSRENKAGRIFQTTTISYPLIRTHACAYQGVRTIRFPENLACFVFLEQPFWGSPFCLSADDFLKILKHLIDKQQITHFKIKSITSNISNGVMIGF